MEAIRSSETSGTTQRTTRRHIPEEDTLQNHRCENLKSYRKRVILLEGSQAPPVRPSDECNMKVKTLGWLEAVA
jgi:hypothetical protein